MRLISLLACVLTLPGCSLLDQECLGRSDPPEVCDWYGRTFEIGVFSAEAASGACDDSDPLGLVSYSDTCDLVAVWGPLKPRKVNGDVGNWAEKCKTPEVLDTSSPEWGDTHGCDLVFSNYRGFGIEIRDMDSASYEVIGEAAFYGDELIDILDQPTDETFQLSVGGDVSVQLWVSEQP